MGLGRQAVHFVYTATLTYSSCLYRLNFIFVVRIPSCFCAFILFFRHRKYVLCMSVVSAPAVMLFHRPGLDCYQDEGAGCHSTCFWLASLTR